MPIFVIFLEILMAADIMTCNVEKAARNFLMHHESAKEVVKQYGNTTITSVLLPEGNLFAFTTDEGNSVAFLTLTGASWVVCNILENAQDPQYRPIKDFLESVRQQTFSCITDDIDDDENRAEVIRQAYTDDEKPMPAEVLQLQKLFEDLLIPGPWVLKPYYRVILDKKEDDSYVFPLYWDSNVRRLSNALIESPGPRKDVAQCAKFISCLLREDLGFMAPNLRLDASGADMIRHYANIRRLPLTDYNIISILAQYPESDVKAFFKQHFKDADYNIPAYLINRTRIMENVKQYDSKKEMKQHLLTPENVKKIHKDIHKIYANDLDKELDKASPLDLQYFGFMKKYFEPALKDAPDLNTHQMALKDILERFSKTSTDALIDDETPNLYPFAELKPAEFSRMVSEFEHILRTPSLDAALLEPTVVAHEPIQLSLVPIQQEMPRVSNYTSFSPPQYSTAVMIGSWTGQPLYPHGATYYTPVSIYPQFWINPNAYTPVFSSRYTLPSITGNLVQGTYCAGIPTMFENTMTTGPSARFLEQTLLSGRTFL